MKKFLLHLTFALTALNVHAHQQAPLFINSQPDNQESFDFSTLSEEETVVALHFSLGFLYSIKNQLTKTNKNDLDCSHLPTQEKNNKNVENDLNALNSIKYNTPKVEALKNELIQLTKELSALMPSREECEAQKRLLEEQKAALEKAHGAN